MDKTLHYLVRSHLDGIYKNSNFRPSLQKLEDEADDIVEEIKSSFSTLNDQDLFDAWIAQQKYMQFLYEIY